MFEALLTLEITDTRKIKKRMATRVGWKLNIELIPKKANIKLN